MKIPTILPAAMWAVLASFSIVGCSSKPIDELKMAGNAMNKASSVEALKYAPQDWQRAQNQRQEAYALIDIGRYSEAREVLIDAIASYKEAEANAKGRVDSLQFEVKELQSTAETELKKIEDFCESSKVKPSVRRRIESAISHIDEKISAMNAALDAKEYMVASMEGQEVVRYMTDLQKRLKTSQ